MDDLHQRYYQSAAEAEAQDQLEMDLGEETYRSPLPWLCVMLLVAILCVLGIVSQAGAAPACGERAKFVSHLGTKYEEKPLALGVSQTGSAVFEVFVSKEGSWTLLMTTAKGASCIMAAGHSWQQKDRLALLPKS